MNRHLSVAILVACGALPLAHAATPTTPLVYPAKGQGAQQQDKDKYACHDWARSQSGFDPTQAPPPATQTPATAAPAQSTAGGMLAGAAGGAAVAELTHHDVARDAATGVVGSALIGRVRQRQSAQSKQQQSAEQQAVREQQRAGYLRGFGACMEGRGYVVR